MSAVHRIALCIILKCVEISYCLQVLDASTNKLWHYNNKGVCMNALLLSFLFFSLLYILPITQIHHWTTDRFLSILSLQVQYLIQTHIWNNALLSERDWFRAESSYFLSLIMHWKYSIILLWHVWLIIMILDIFPLFHHRLCRSGNLHSHGYLLV